MAVEEAEGRHEAAPRIGVAIGLGIVDAEMDALEASGLARVPPARHLRKVGPRHYGILLRKPEGACLWTGGTGPSRNGSCARALCAARHASLLALVVNGSSKLT